jgi:hypothetical protein
MMDEIRKIRMKFWCDAFLLSCSIENIHNKMPWDKADESLEEFDKRFWEVGSKEHRIYLKQQEHLR